MDKDRMRKAIIAMLEGLIPINSTWCEVVSVTNQECTVKIDGLEIEGILLGFDKSDVIVYPKVNTDVLVAFVDNTNTNGVVMLVKETDKIEIMGSNYKGIPILDEIKNNLDAIKTYLTNQKTAIDAGFDAVGIGSAANGTTGKLTYSAAMASNTITFTNMENPKVKHGNG